MVDFTLNAKVREDAGKGASRRLRRLADEVPAIVYGGTQKPQSISLVHNEFSHALENEAFYSHIIRLTIGGKTEDVILKDVQRHPAQARILHADFLRVSKTKKLQTRVPLHFTNEETAIGVKQQGGVVSHSMTDLEISCLPADLPEYLEVDVASLEMGGVLHISDIKLPKGVESVELSHGEEHDQAIVTIHKPRAAVEAEEVEEAPAEAEEGAEEAEAKEEEKAEKKEEGNGE